MTAKTNNGLFWENFLLHPSYCLSSHTAAAGWVYWAIHISNPSIMLHTHTCVRTHTHTHTHTCACTFTHTHTHKHTHTHTQWIINLIYIAQFNTNGILTALYIVITYIQMQYVHVWNNHINTHIHVYTYTHTPSHVQIYIYRHTNKIDHTHIANLPILIQLHVCLGTYYVHA